MIFIVGKSGSGKSTLLNLLGGLDNLTSGEILIDEKSIGKFNKTEYDAYRNTYIGFIFQEFNVLEQYNVYENIELALALQNEKAEPNQIEDLLTNLGMNGLEKRKINELSGGQKQRVAIARALIKRPRIILADEPTGNLDQKSSEQIFTILKNISKNGLVIVVSHDMESARKYADRIIEIEDGNIVSDSNPNIQNIEQSFQLKKSKLPFSYALKMALTSFKTKPIKLFMTILLTAMSLIFMGLTINSVLFDKTRFIINTIKDNNNYVFTVSPKNFISKDNISSLLLNSENIQYLEEFTNSKINPIYSLYDNGVVLKFEFGGNKNRSDFYEYGPGFVQFIDLHDSRILGNLIGTEPKKSNEIVVHKYFADYAIKYGIMDTNNELYFPKNYEDFIASKHELKLGKNKMIVVGIIDDDDHLFLEIKNGGYFGTYELKSYFSEMYSEKGTLIYTKDFIENAILESDKTSLLNHAIIYTQEKGSTKDVTSGKPKPLTEAISMITKDGIESISSLEKGNIILSIDSLKNLDNEFDSKFNNYLKLQSGEINYDALLQEFIISYLKGYSPNLYVSFYTTNYDTKYHDLSYNLIGISLDENNYVSNQYIEEYEPVTKQSYAAQIYNNNSKELTKILNTFVFNELDKINLEPGNFYSYTLDHSNDINNIIVIYKGLYIYILIVSLVFVLFTFLLFSNFISVSISYCKKEIGILRALGATNNDVIKIFGYESLIIAVLAWILSMIGWIITCNLLNNSLFGNMYYSLNGIITHPLVPIIMFAYTIAIALFITTVSINHITKIKPIDAILNK